MTKIALNETPCIKTIYTGVPRFSGLHAVVILILRCLIQKVLVSWQIVIQGFELLHPIFV